MTISTITTLATISIMSAPGVYWKWGTATLLIVAIGAVVHSLFKRKRGD